MIGRYSGRCDRGGQANGPKEVLRKRETGRGRHASALGERPLPSRRTPSHRPCDTSDTNGSHP